MYSLLYLSYKSLAKVVLDLRDHIIVTQATARVILRALHKLLYTPSGDPGHDPFPLTPFSFLYFSNLFSQCHRLPLYREISHYTEFPILDTKSPPSLCIGSLSSYSWDFPPHPPQDPFTVHLLSFSLPCPSEASTYLRDSFCCLSNNLCSSDKNNRK